MKPLPLYKQIQNDIRKFIENGTLKEGDRVPSEKELAEQYRVSQITSKNALIGLVEEGLLVRVQGKGTFIKRELSHLHELEQREEPEENKVIGLILPTMKTKVDQHLFDYLEKYIADSGYELMVRITRESQEEETRVIENFIAKQVQGLIIFPVEKENYNNAILRLSLEKFPLVLIDRFLKEIVTYSVSSDNVNGVFEAVNYLIEKGHTAIAFISPEITNTVTDERALGFEKAIVHHKRSINKHLWCLLNLETIMKGTAKEEIISFLQERPEITAVVTVNTELCHYAYSAIKELNKSIPDEIELISFDDPGLEQVSYIQQNEEEMSRLTVNLLVEQIEGKYDPQRIVVPVTFVT